MVIILESNLRTCLFLSLLFLLIPNALAARCPTPDEIRARKISLDYDWSVNESVTLDSLLSVTRLTSVSIENNGEFIACKYESDQQDIRLDGLPRFGDCAVVPDSENWLTSEDGKTICVDKTPLFCHFKYECN